MTRFAPRKLDSVTTRPSRPVSEKSGAACPTATREVSVAGPRKSSRGPSRWGWALAVAATVVVVLLVADVRGAIGFSSFAVLFYYGVANASASTLTTHDRRWPRALPGVGLVGCVVLGFSLPTTSIVGGAVVLVAGFVVWTVRRRRGFPSADADDATHSS